jgi:hypothetical protein
MNDLFQHASDDFGELVPVSVSAEFAPIDPGPTGRFDEWLFKFRAGTFCVAVDPNDDTVKIVATNVGNSHVVNVTDQPPWSALVGSRLRWGWTLTNQRGYTDGVQLEFFHERDFWIIQVIAEASSLTSYSISPLNRMMNLR